MSRGWVERFSGRPAGWGSGSGDGEKTIYKATDDGDVVNTRAAEAPKGVAAVGGRGSLFSSHGTFSWHPPSPGPRPCARLKVFSCRLLDRLGDGQQDYLLVWFGKLDQSLLDIMPRLITGNGGCLVEARPQVDPENANSFFFRSGEERW